MENIQVSDPKTGKTIKIEINPESVEHQQAWRVTFDDNKSALIGVDQHGIWKHFDGTQLDSGLISAIGKAIENQQGSSS